nr:VOC family protein [Chitinophagaceae bacterium]
KICYIGIPADDINASAAFYKAVFDWEIRTRSDGTIAFTDSVGEVSGTWLTNCKPAAEPGFMIYVMVYDIAEMLDKVVLNGGLIVDRVNAEAKEITATFTDLFGNIIGLYQQPV